MNDGYNTYEIRSVASGFVAVEFIGCEKQFDGVAKETADRIVKRWAPTPRAAERKLRGSKE